MLHGAETTETSHYGFHNLHQNNADMAPSSLHLNCHYWLQKRCVRMWHLNTDKNNNPVHLPVLHRIHVFPRGSFSFCTAVHKHISCLTYTGIQIRGLWLQKCIADKEIWDMRDIMHFVSDRMNLTFMISMVHESGACPEETHTNTSIWYKLVYSSRQVQICSPEMYTSDLYINCQQPPVCW